MGEHEAAAQRRNDGGRAGAGRTAGRRRRPAGLALVLAAAAALAGGLAAPPAVAQPAFQVKDLNTATVRHDSSGGSGFATLPGLVLFNADDGVAGDELWVSDGTAAGTHQLKEICPGLCPSHPQELTVVGATVFFVADDGVHGAELWKSDGTAAGTVLVKDLWPGVNSYFPYNLAAVGGRLVFLTGGRLWASDGTAAGTQPIGQFINNLLGLGVLGGTYLFFADDGVHGAEPWKTDGTAAGTVMVADIAPGSAGSQPQFAPQAAALGGRLYFNADDGVHGEELWTTDGTADGTLLVRDIQPGAGSSEPASLTPSAGVLYFVATDANGQELWRTDGTTAGTTLVADIRPGAGHSSPSGLTDLAGQLFFSANDGVHGYELWASDGTAAGTRLVKDVQPGSGSSLSIGPGFVVLAGRLVFFADDGVHGGEPWASDGTADGTVLLADLAPGAAASALGGPAASGGQVFFTARTPAGVALYRTDGTAAGTVRLAWIDTQTTAFAVSYFGRLTGRHPLADLAGTLLFQAGDGSATPALARSDGTPAGTALVVPSSGPVPSLPQDLTPAGGRIFFSAEDEVAHGIGFWASDGTADGTRQLSDYQPGQIIPEFDPIVAAGARACFVRWHYPQRYLWCSDGTPAGTVPLTDDSVIFTSNPVAQDGKVFFGLFGDTGGELWATDGRPAGTARMWGGGALADVPTVVAAAGKLLFFVSGGEDHKLWVSDGTQAGTVSLVRDTATFDFFGDLLGTPGYEPAGAGGKLFFRGTDDKNGEELWVSDATDAGTHLVKDILHGARSSEPLSLTALGQRVVFVADDGVHGRELWISDGTDAGTHLVSDVLPGGESSVPQELAAVDGRLLFTAWDGVHGREPWISDGTPAGTRMVQDIAPGPLSSSPLSFTASGQNVYFAANDNATGFELWAIPRAALSPALDFYTVAPCRVFDTRQGAVLVSGVARRFPIAGSCGIPATAKAVAGNVTVVPRALGGHVTVYPAYADLPPTSTLNFGPFQVRANSGALPLAEGSVEAIVRLTGGAGADLLLDVVGYFE